MGIFNIYQEHRDLKKRHTDLHEAHLKLTEDHRQLSNAYSREIGQMLQLHQRQEQLIRTGDQMYRQLETALHEIQSLVKRHLDAGETRIPARALWHVMHNAGITAGPKPELNHKEAIAQKNAPRLDQEKQQNQSQEQERKHVQSRGMRI
jgi:hypothetical protein